MRAKVCHRFCHGGGALAHGGVDTDDVLVALVENRIDGDRGFTGLAISEDQLSLAAPDGDEGVDYLDAGL